MTVGDIDEIYRMTFAENNALRATVWTHSLCVARKAILCALNRNIDADLNFIFQAAMLHDIGVGKCDAPSIFCFGKLPYICHGVEGSKIMNALGFPRHALVCERHTGAGISVKEIEEQNLPLPHRNMLPVSIEEKLICYADKFFSKSSDLTREKSVDSILRQMEKFGPDPLRRFLDMHNSFS